MKASSRDFTKGFTLVELMIVVTIIGVLAAIAIPSFLRYQLRSKFAELKTNVEAINKSEHSLRQSERVACLGAATGQFVTFTQIPGAAPGTARVVWTPADLLAASSLDWVVQGGTYGVYAAVTAEPPIVTAPELATCAATPGLGALGGALTIAATSDIDGDGVGALVAAFTPSLDASGSVTTAAPSAGTGMFASGPATVDATTCPGGTQPGGVGNGQVGVCSRDSTF